MSKKQKLGPNQLKWVRDLETTKARQTTGVLHNSQGYCCLGRACVVMGVKGVGEGPKGSRQYSYKEAITCLPDPVKMKLAMRDDCGCPLDIAKFSALSVLNDDKKYTFKEIAKVLRKNPEQYFVKPA